MQLFPREVHAIFCVNALCDSATQASDLNIAAHSVAQLGVA